MNSKPKILAFGGSLRRDSLNQKLAVVAAESARAAGADVTVVTLREFEIPPYDGDLEAASGLPAGVKRFKQALKDHDAFLVACPEYNGSITGVLKNALDWASRAEPGEPALACFTGKVAGLVAASPGPFGGIRGLPVARALFVQLQMLVVPDQLALAKAGEAFGPDGRLLDAKHQASVDKVAARVVRVTAALRAVT